MDFSHLCVALCFFVLLWRSGCQQSLVESGAGESETDLQHSVGVDEEVATWASSYGITPDTIRVLTQEGFTSLMLLRHLSSHDITESLQKPGLLSLAQSLALKKAVQKLCDEGTQTCGRNEELPPEEPQVESGEASQQSRTETFIKHSDPRMERTFIAVKPDGVQRGLIGEITKRFEQRGYKLVAAKMCMPGKAHLEKHYSDLSSKPFFSGLVEYMNSGPIFAMVWEGKDAVKMGRMMLGATNPRESLPGTIRGDFCIDVGRNICHGSDKVESAKKEIDLWFKPEELMSYDYHSNPWVYE